MCFRPGDIEAPLICTECNNRVPIVAGFRPSNCPMCGAELPGEGTVAGLEAMQAPRSAAPGGGGAPSAPASPPTPKPSGGASKPPTASGN